MTFIHPVWFRVNLPQVSVMRFIAETPSEYYLMGASGDSLYHVVVLTEDVVEYLTNEFRVNDLVMTTPAEVKMVLRSCSKKWGNQELLHLE